MQEFMLINFTQTIDGYSEMVASSEESDREHMIIVMGVQVQM